MKLPIPVNFPTPISMGGAEWAEMSTTRRQFYCPVAVYVNYCQR